MSFTPSLFPPSLDEPLAMDSKQKARVRDNLQALRNELHLNEICKITDAVERAIALGVPQQMLERNLQALMRYHFKDTNLKLQMPPRRISADVLIANGIAPGSLGPRFRQPGPSLNTRPSPLVSSQPGHNLGTQPGPTSGAQPGPNFGAQPAPRNQPYSYSVAADINPIHADGRSGLVNKALSPTMASAALKAREDIRRGKPIGLVPLETPFPFQAPPRPDVQPPLLRNAQATQAGVQTVVLAHGPLDRPSGEGEMGIAKLRARELNDKDLDTSESIRLAQLERNQKRTSESNNTGALYESNQGEASKTMTPAAAIKATERDTSSRGLAAHKDDTQEPKAPGGLDALTTRDPQSPEMATDTPDYLVRQPSPTCIVVDDSEPSGQKDTQVMLPRFSIPSAKKKPGRPKSNKNTNSTSIPASNTAGVEDEAAAKPKPGIESIQRAASLALGPPNKPDDDFTFSIPQYPRRVFGPAPVPINTARALQSKRTPLPSSAPASKRKPLRPFKPRGGRSSYATETTRVAKDAAAKAAPKPGAESIQRAVSLALGTSNKHHDDDDDDDDALPSSSSVPTGSGRKPLPSAARTVPINTARALQGKRKPLPSSAPARKRPRTWPVGERKTAGVAGTVADGVDGAGDAAKDKAAGVDDPTGALRIIEAKAKEMGVNPYGPLDTSLWMELFGPWVPENGPSEKPKDVDKGAGDGVGSDGDCLAPIAAAEQPKDMDKGADGVMGLDKDCLASIAASALKLADAMADANLPKHMDGSHEDASDVQVQPGLASESNKMVTTPGDTTETDAEQITGRDEGQDEVMGNTPQGAAEEDPKEVAAGVTDGEETDD